MSGAAPSNSILDHVPTLHEFQTLPLFPQNKRFNPAIRYCRKSGFFFDSMDSVGSIASSGLTITLCPTQLFVAAGLLGVVVVSNAKSLLFAWHVKSPSPTCRPILTIAGTTLPAACTAFPSTTEEAYSKKRGAWRRVTFCTSRYIFVYASS
jgi:hypothetical protein